MRSLLSGRAAGVLAALALAGTVGCGGGPKTYPVQGKITLTGGDVSHLAGCTIEAALQTNPYVRASGEIAADGRFTLGTLHEGVLLTGAQEGPYQARILLSDDDRTARRLAARAVAPRYLDFRTAGLSFQAPAAGEVTLTLSPR